MRSAVCDGFRGMNDFSFFREQLSEWKMDLNEQQENMLLRYFEMLVEKNKVMNLTAITSWEEVCTKHFLDSAALLHVIPPPFLEGKNLIDIGAGAGFPGLVLKILSPTTGVTLLDALSKRVRFLSSVIDQLNLDNLYKNTQSVSRETFCGCRAVHGRAEELTFVKKNLHNKIQVPQNSGGEEKHNATERFRGAFDIVTARAVSELRILSEYGIPLLKTGGCFFAYKSANTDFEVKQAEKAIALLGGKIQKVYKYQLPRTDISRSLIVIQKVKPTPNQYPRPSAHIKKKPL